MDNQELLDEIVGRIIYDTIGCISAATKSDLKENNEEGTLSLKVTDKDFKILDNETLAIVGSKLNGATFALEEHYRILKDRNIENYHIIPAIIKMNRDVLNIIKNRRRNGMWGDDE